MSIQILTVSGSGSYLLINYTIAKPPYTAEDGVTTYTAEDGATAYTIE